MNAPSGRSVIVTIAGTRVFAHDGGMRLFVRRKNGNWEERFIPDEEMEPLLYVDGGLYRASEFWDRFQEK